MKVSTPTTAIGRRVIWKLPQTWRAPSLPQRAVLYPLLYLRSLGFDTQVRWNLTRRDLQEADAFVVVSDGALTGSDLELLGAASDRGARVLYAPTAGVTDMDALRMAESGGAAVFWSDDGPMSSGAPAVRGVASAEAPGAAARAAEDALLAGEFGEARAAPAGRFVPSGPYVFAAVEGAAALIEIAPALRRRLAETGLGLCVAADEPLSLPLEMLGLGEVAVLDSRASGVLAAMAGADAVLCVHPSLPPSSPAPAVWVRTALMLGVPVVASSHASLDGLAHLCVLDDWERGLSLYRSLPAARREAVAQAQTFLAERLRSSHVAETWRRGARARRGCRAPTDRRAAEPAGAAGPVRPRPGFRRAPAHHRGAARAPVGRGPHRGHRLARDGLAEDPPGDRAQGTGVPAGPEGRGPAGPDALAGRGRRGC
ncbi:MAG: hypothetical protein WDM92_00395 [Caulobacteraceae bacterium]